MKEFMTPAADIAQLSPAACRVRQQRLCQKLREADLQGAVISDPRHVHYFTGYWARTTFPSALFVAAGGATVLSVAGAPDTDPAADSVEIYCSNQLATQLDNLPDAAANALAKLCRGRIGFDRAVDLALELAVRAADLKPALYALRRTKDADEIAMLQRAVEGCTAAYARAREVVAPGVTEVELFSEMLAAAIVTVGEPVGEMGNDFRAGSGGGAPRLRTMQAGELIPLDVSVVVRGYSSDLCRTFAVDGNPTAPQQRAQRAVVAELDYIEATVRPGVSCRALYHEVHTRLNGVGGWSFPHHLGHGIGLNAHEAPRLNPHWDDVFAVGDVFTAEPGLYGAELNAGIRIEQDYALTANGLLSLCAYPTDL